MKGVYMKRIAQVVVLGGLYLCSLASMGPIASAAQQTATPTRTPDVIYVPTPPEVVKAMLDTAGVTAKDLVYDLGCGDGRIVIAASTAARKRLLYPGQLPPTSDSPSPP